MSINNPTFDQWPPAPFDQMIEEMRIWTAWWASDIGMLTDVYSNHARYRRKNYRTDMLHSVDDTFFWGRPSDGHIRRRHVTAAASVARASAGLLFGKPPRIEAGEGDADNPRFVERLNTIFGPDAYGGKLAAAAELQSVLGGVYLRPWWDKDVASHVVPSHVAADCAIPEFRYDRLAAVTFWSIVSEEGCTPVLRHLERHEKGRIIHSLWAGTENTLGDQIALDEHPATAWVAEAGHEEGVIETGIDELDVVYIRNVHPQRIWHSVPILNQLGRSDFDGIEGEFDALDEIETSWMRDVEDGKSRLFISEEMLDDNGPGRGGTYDPDKHLYTPTKTGMGSLNDGGPPPITDVKFAIRWEEHSQTKTNIKQNILEHVGLSSQHFADGPLAVTATAVDSDNNITETTRAVKISQWKSELARFINIVMRLDAIHFPGLGVKPTSPVTVRFSSQHIQSEGERVSNVASKRSAGVCSREQGIRELNPDWTDVEVKDELARIYEDELFDTKLAFGQGLEDEGAGEATEGTEGGMEDTARQIEDVAEDLAKGADHDEDVTFEEAEQEAEEAL